MKSIALVIFAGAFVTVQAVAVSVTPVEKVIELLQKLDKQLVEEGKREAAAYDKYACFCKEQIDNKVYATEKSEKKISGLNATISKLDTDIGKLTGEISDLHTKIQEQTTTMKEQLETNDLNQTDFRQTLAEIDDAISACERAITALKDSKTSMGGKTELEALVQLGSMSFDERIRSKAQKISSSLAAGQPGKAFESAYHSNDIIETIEDLRTVFKERRKEVDENRHAANAFFETEQLSVSNQNKFDQQEKAEKEFVSEKKTQEKQAASKELQQEEADLDADEKFKVVLTEECESKATLWDQRSKQRAAERTALSEATTSLRDGVAPNWKANKKLSGVQKYSKVRSVKSFRRSPPGPLKTLPAMSFLQLRGRALRGQSKSIGSQAEARKTTARVHDLLDKYAQHLKSPMLSVVALKVLSAQDHFVKVRSLIKDLIAQLETQALNEATKKQLCDEQMDTQTKARDAQKAIMEEQDANINAAEAKVSQLENEIGQLSSDIAASAKAVTDAQTLRDEEKAENVKSLAQAKDGKKAVEKALQLLSDFYTKAVLIQRSAYTPPNSDRDGNTVKDVAPEVFDEEYNGNQEASKGILGMLEVIASDFERTITEVEDQEESSAEDHSTFKTKSEENIKTKEDSVKEKNGQVTISESEIVESKDALKLATDSHQQAVKMLKDLHAECVASDETQEERRAKRDKEIAALKEAHDILESLSK